MTMPRGRAGFHPVPIQVRTIAVFLLALATRDLTAHAEKTC